MKKIFLPLLAILLVSSCNKTEPVGDPVSNNPSNATELGSLTIPSSFNWSSSIKGSLVVTMDVPQYMAIDGQYLYLADENLNILDRSKVSNSGASFYFTAPQTKTKVFLYHPGTETVQEVTGTGNVTFKIEGQDRFAIADAAANQNKKGGAIAPVDHKTNANLLINGDFSVNDIGQDNASEYNRRVEGKWYRADTKGSIQSVSGNDAYQSQSNNNYTCIMQSVAISPGAAYTFSAIYGTTGSEIKKNMYVDFFDANGTWLSYHSVNCSNGTATKSGTAPNNAAYIQIYVSLKKYTWVDDIVLDVAPSVSDADNDGVPDDQDDYPNDPTRAYTSNFPTSGYQTVSFEDLWPAKGDFDLNDMVLVNQVVYTSDASNNRVDATFTVSLEAVGSGFSNGLALVFTDANNQFLGQNIIASVTGDAAVDPNVTNGIIVFNDVYLAQSTYYQNNAVGPSMAADVFTFTVTFNGNAGSQAIIPDVYIFRTSDRGLEVHLDGFSGTSAANSAYNNTIDDVNGTYSTSTGLPWALEVVTQGNTYKHPKEKVDILLAYPNFQSWAESNGSSNADWLDSPDVTKIFQQ